jgi:hypothetical protein
MKTYRFLGIIFTCFIISSQWVFSQESFNAADYYVDFSVPDVGAFTLLNTKPANISTPGNVKELAVILLNVASSGSTIAPGIALDWSPAATFYKPKTNEEYRKIKPIRNLQITFGSVADSLGTRVGAGIKWTFIDKSDPLDDVALSNSLNEMHDVMWMSNNHQKSMFDQQLKSTLLGIFQKRNFAKSMEAYSMIKSYSFNVNDSSIIDRSVADNYSMVVDSINAMINRQTGIDSLNVNDDEKVQLMTLCIDFKEIVNNNTKYRTAFISDIKAEKEKWLKDHWNATVVSFGAGWVGLSPDNKWSSLNTQLFKSYLNGKIKVSKKSQAVLLGSFGLPNNPIISDSSVVRQFSVGGRFLIGDAYKRFSMDIGYYYDVAKKTSFNGENLIVSLGYEYKIAEGLFLEVVTGYKGEPSSFFKNSNILALGNLKFALRPKQRFRSE